MINGLIKKKCSKTVFLINLRFAFPKPILAVPADHPPLDVFDANKCFYRIISFA